MDNHMVDMAPFSGVWNVHYSPATKFSSHRNPSPTQQANNHRHHSRYWDSLQTPLGSSESLVSLFRGHPKPIKDAIAVVHQFARNEHELEQEERSVTLSLSPTDYALFLRIIDTIDIQYGSVSWDYDLRGEEITIEMLTSHHEASTSTCCTVVRGALDGEIKKYVSDPIALVQLSTVEGSTADVKMNTNPAIHGGLKVSVRGKQKKADPKKKKKTKTKKYQPDQQFYSMNHSLAYGCPYPPIVTETAMSQSLYKLHGRLIRWIAEGFGRITLAIGFYCPAFTWIPEDHPNRIPPVKLVTYRKVASKCGNPKIYGIEMQDCVWISDRQGNPRSGKHTIRLDQFLYIRDFKNKVARQRNNAPHRLICPPLELLKAKVEINFETYHVRIRQRMMLDNINGKTLSSSGSGSEKCYAVAIQNKCRKGRKKNPDEDSDGLSSKSSSTSSNNSMVAYSIDNANKNVATSPSTEQPELPAHDETSQPHEPNGHDQANTDQDTDADDVPDSDCRTPETFQEDYEDQGNYSFADHSFGNADTELNDSPSVSSEKDLLFRENEEPHNVSVIQEDLLDKYGTVYDVPPATWSPLDDEKGEEMDQSEKEQRMIDEQLSRAQATAVDAIPTEYADDPDYDYEMDKLAGVEEEEDLGEEYSYTSEEDSSSGEEYSSANEEFEETC
ncbi:hypothetical protein BJ508DRAFT_328876 [Ascobolus immersus RN42]|uniref:Uncharacterized protein n=1 Tax=Ascobolus immersus RN42 TaxID=1160509 RepID=A0A3N4I0C9_ASCIM|nr:hypothetical protein BJ508DRAFT_328876 [Ascobolus immersus RN42]